MISETDIIIVGAGPLGIELAIQLKRLDAAYIQLEAAQIGDTIANWPRQTQFFSAPERVALAGVPVHSPNQQSLTGEMYLGYLRTLVELFRLDIRTYEPVVDARREEDGRFLLTTRSLTGDNRYRCRRLVLATGNMNRPRRLGIPGEDLPHVFHRLDDPHRFFRKRLLIVGGKNSALEAALRCWRIGAKVMLSYRRAEFETSIVKPHLAREIDILIEKEKLDFFPETVLCRVEPGVAILQQAPSGEETAVETDFVLLRVGFEMDQTLYQQLGVSLEGEAGKPVFDPNTMETRVPGVYVCGTAAGGMEREHELFIVTAHGHVEKIVTQLTGQRPGEIGADLERSYEISFDEIKED